MPQGFFPQPSGFLPLEKPKHFLVSVVIYVLMWLGAQGALACQQLEHIVAGVLRNSASQIIIITNLV